MADNEDKTVNSSANYGPNSSPSDRPKSLSPKAAGRQLSSPGTPLSSATPSPEQSDLFKSSEKVKETELETSEDIAKQVCKNSF